MNSWQQVLNVAPTDTINTIRRKYRALALRTHPNKPGGDTAAFRRVQNAWERAQRHFQSTSTRPVPNRPVSPPPVRTIPITIGLSGEGMRTYDFLTVRTNETVRAVFDTVVAHVSRLRDLGLDLDQGFSVSITTPLMKRSRDFAAPEDTSFASLVHPNLLDVMQVYVFVRRKGMSRKKWYFVPSTQQPKTTKTVKIMPRKIAARWESTIELPKTITVLQLYLRVAAHLGKDDLALQWLPQSRKQLYSDIGLITHHRKEPKTRITTPNTVFFINAHDFGVDWYFRASTGRFMRSRSFHWRKQRDPRPQQTPTSRPGAVRVSKRGNVLTSARARIARAVKPGRDPAVPRKARWQR